MQKTSDTTDWNVIKKIESEDFSLIQRLNEMGFKEGLAVRLVRTISFGSVYVIQFEDSIVALNSMEMKCLKLQSM